MQVLIIVVLLFLNKQRAPVVQRVDNAIRRINQYPVDSIVCFTNTYPLDSDLSGYRSGCPGDQRLIEKPADSGLKIVPRTMQLG